MRFLFLLVLLLSTAGYGKINYTPGSEPQSCTNLNLSGIYGYNRFHLIGGSAELSRDWRFWSGRHTSGKADIGILTSYITDPVTSANYYDSISATFGNYHLMGLLQLGGTVHLHPRQRIVFGVHGFYGWSHLILRGSLNDRKNNISSDYKADKGIWTSGLSATLGWQISDHLAIISKGYITLPNYISDITPFVMASLGVSYRLW